MISPEQLAELWRKHATSLELLARARCAAPEDCVQKAFIRLASQPSAPDDPMAWLARVVRNLAIDQGRMERRRRRHEQAFAATYERTFRQADPADIDGLDYRAVAEALRTLDVELQELVTARIWGGLTFRQMAEAFDQSSSAVHRRYVAALDQLRKLLAAGENSGQASCLPGESGRSVK